MLRFSEELEPKEKDRPALGSFTRLTEALFEDVAVFSSPMLDITLAFGSEIGASPFSDRKMK